MAHTALGVGAEFDIVRDRIVAMGDAVAKESGVTIPYQVGTMIELPRAALKAEEIAQSAEFFSFGTNDLTQTVFGLSRDDAGKFLPAYVEQGILEKDPFVSIDVEGVGLTNGDYRIDELAERVGLSPSQIVRFDGNVPAMPPMSARPAETRAPPRKLVPKALKNIA